MPRTPSTAEADLPVSLHETVRTYSLLADEYASHEHQTTRRLELLSVAGLSRSRFHKFASATPNVLELGAGTGAVTREIQSYLPTAQLVLTDPAPGMVEVLRNLPATHHRRRVVQATAAEALRWHGRAADFVIAGLADPFADDAFFGATFAHIRPGTVLFLSVPSKEWALEERAGRLKIPADRTRFSDRLGRTLWASSWAYDERELTEKGVEAGFQLVESGTEIEPARTDQEAQPSVAWALLRRDSAEEI